jgi:F420H(2)-dependent biliverdin reductase
VRPSGRAHLVPIWFVWVDGAIWICTGTDSVKVRNLRNNPSIALSLENGSAPVIAEGEAVFAHDVPEAVSAEFLRKYQWSIKTDTDYGTLLRVTPSKWIRWS